MRRTHFVSSNPCEDINNDIVSVFSKDTSKHSNGSSNTSSAYENAFYRLIAKKRKTTQNPKNPPKTDIKTQSLLTPKPSLIPMLLSCRSQSPRNNISPDVDLQKTAVRDKQVSCPEEVIWQNRSKEEREKQLFWKQKEFSSAEILSHEPQQPTTRERQYNAQPPSSTSESQNKPHRMTTLVNKSTNPAPLGTTQRTTKTSSSSNSRNVAVQGNYSTMSSPLLGNSYSSSRSSSRKNISQRNGSFKRNATPQKEELNRSASMKHMKRISPPHLPIPPRSRAAASKNCRKNVTQLKNSPDDREQKTSSLDGKGKTNVRHSDNNSNSPVRSKLDAYYAGDRGGPRNGIDKDIEHASVSSTHKIPKDNFKELLTLPVTPTNSITHGEPNIDNNTSCSSNKTIVPDDDSSVIDHQRNPFYKSINTPYYGAVDENNKVSLKNTNCNSPSPNVIPGKGFNFVFNSPYRKNKILHSFEHLGKDQEPINVPSESKRRHNIISSTAVGNYSEMFRYSDIPIKTGVKTLQRNNSLTHIQTPMSTINKNKTAAAAEQLS